ncbi:uncharacterized protein OCT59_025353 [Rhizophagus irregularis]|uniref:uncharacterized protein n=1 Tax=Rhizophagus irregularis TaxID=588596 RepID=UPI00331F5909|nr:hypothetical protein OCT59_025353 [Rhizophagus irregularis]
MAVQFFTKLSQNYIELLKDDEYYDIIIEVGEDPNVKIFRAHKNILCYRSPYLRRILASNKKNNDNILAHIKLPKISPEIFQIILDYIYGGILSLNMHNTSKDFLNVLVAADSLHLQELSFDFTLLSEKSLISLIKMDDLQMKEIEVWEHVLKWGLAQNPTLIPDPSIWSDDDFKKMKNTLQHILPSIRFFSLSSKEFLKKVRPYKKLLNDQLYEDIVNSHMDPDSEPANNISPPRNIKNEKIIDSKIVNLDIVSMVSKWIDKTVIINNSKYDHLRELYLPYEFKLLLRGSRDGFTPKKFHELCDGKHNTVTFIKIEGTEEILGGYNPLKWESTNSYGKTEDSFIFSFKNKHIKDVIISKVKDKNYAIFYKYEHGPQFGGDIVMSSSNEFIDYETISYQQDDYEKKFSMEDYEVFQIIKK